MITYREPRPYPVPDHDDLFSCYNWHPDMPDNVILRMSKSSVGDFTFCKQQYAINRVLGMKEPQNDNMLREQMSTIVLNYFTSVLMLARQVKNTILKDTFVIVFHIPVRYARLKITSS